MRLEGNQSLNTAMEAKLINHSSKETSTKEEVKKLRFVRVTSKEGAHKEPSLEATQKAADKLNEMMEKLNHDFRYNVHADTKRIFVQVIDKHTGKVVDEIPPKKVLDMLAQTEKKAGLVFDRLI